MSTPMRTSMKPARRSREQRLAALIRLGKTSRPPVKPETAPLHLVSPAAYPAAGTACA